MDEGRGAGRTRQQLGGSFLVAGSVGFGIKVLSSLVGPSSALGTTLLGSPSAIYIGSMVLLALGAAIVAIARPPLRSAGLARAALSLSAIGFVGLAYLEANPVQGDPLSSWGIMLIYLCYPLGQLSLGIALLPEPGPSRVFGALLIVALPAMVLVLESQGPVAAPGAGVSIIEVLGTIGLLACAAGIALSWAGLGVLVFRSASGPPLPVHGGT